MKSIAAQGRDANRAIISSNEAFLLESTWTFATSTTGATGAHTLFTVTDNVLASVFGICDTDLVGAATIEVGTENNTAALIAQMADATGLDDGENWVDAASETEISVLPGMKIINDGADILLTIGAAAISAGKVDFYCLFRPLNSSANVTITTPA